MSAEYEALDKAIDRAQAATRVYHGLLEEFGLDFHEMMKLAVRPPLIREFHAEWLERMSDVIRALAEAEGIADPDDMPRPVKIRLTHRAYSAVLSTFE